MTLSPEHKPITMHNRSSLVSIKERGWYEFVLHNGFTLIEMLVVIAIISILASMLMPELKRTLDISRQVSCQNNLRQMGGAIVNYTADFSGWLPTSCAESSGCHAYWKLQLAPYCGIDAIAINDDQLGRELFLCPEFIIPTIVPQVWKVGGYGWNSSYLGLMPDHAMDRYKAQKIQSVSLPSQTVITGDAPDVGSHDYDFMKLEPPGAGIDKIGTRHNKSINRLWVDTHVTWDPIELIISGNGTDLSYYWKKIK